MNELVPQRPARPLSLEDCRLSTGLWQRLSSDLPADMELAAIVANPVLHAEAKASVAVLAAFAEPCGEQAVRAALQPLILIYGQSEAAKTGAYWRVYFQQLAGFPIEALRQACDDYVGGESAEFFPKPGPLKALAAKRAIPIYKARDRVKRVAAMLPAPKFTPADVETRRAQVAEMLAGFSRPPHAGKATA